MRVHSFFGEPGELAAFQIPVMIYIIFNSRFYVNNKIKSIIFFVTYLVTFTATAYFILAIILLTKLYRRLKYFTIALIIVFAALLLSTSLTFDASSNDNLSDFNLLISGIQQKITESTNFSIKSDVEDFEKLNYSSYALLSNLYVAFNAPSRVFGTGLGTHQESYVRVYQSSFTGYGLNKDDGYSLINRIFSEFGYVGIIVMIIVLYKNFNSKNVINLSSFFFLLTNMLRGGNYIFLGYIFFIFLYYYSSKDIVEENSIYNNKIS
jgi:hypothetical protein